jgi:hypothetical protein
MEEEFSASNKPTETCPNCGSTLFCVVAPQSSEVYNSDPGVALVQCSQCDARFLIQCSDELDEEQTGDSSSFSENLRPGDVLRLPVDLGEIPAGLYMVTQIGYLIKLARCAENEDGDLASTHRIVKVTHNEIERFEPTFLTIAKPL